MRLQRCSTTDSRKSRPDVSRLVVLATLLAVTPALAAQIAHDASVATTDELLEVTVRVAGADPESLFANLNEGLSARLEYAIRILEPRPRALVMLGPRLDREFRVIYDLHFDPFRDRYVVQTQDGGRYLFPDEATLWEFFFELPGYRIPHSALHASGHLYIDTRVTFEPIVFVPGLSILSVFMPRSRQLSAWERDVVEISP